MGSLALGQGVGSLSGSVSGSGGVDSAVSVAGGGSDDSIVASSRGGVGPPGTGGGGASSVEAPGSDGSE